MISWTTPTLPVHVRNADLVSSGCHVAVTIAQGCHSVTVEDPPMEYDSETGTTTLYVGLSQMQSGPFAAGRVRVQVNAKDWMGFRPASDQATTYIGSNLLREVI